MIEEVWNRKNLDLLSELYQSDAKVYLSSEILVGIERLKNEFIRPTLTAFPDLHHEINDIICVGDKVAMRYTGTGTHEKDFAGKKATGGKLEYEGVIFFNMENNLVSEVWNHSNWAEKFEIL